MKEAAALLQLLKLPRMGTIGLSKLATKLISLGTPPQDVFQQTEDILSGSLKFTPEQIEALRKIRYDPSADLLHYRRLEIQALTPWDHRFPNRLRAVLGDRAPVLLFVRGNIELLQLPTLGISGSRRASDSGLCGVTSLCERVASEGWVIVSGGAKGVDEAAHLAAIRCGPGTIIVLPSGVLKARLRKEVEKHLEAEKTLLISQYPPDLGWTVGCAVQRNWVLAGLSRAIVLVEPGLNGGTTTTGKIAQKLKLPLYLLNSGNPASDIENRFKDNGAEFITAYDYSPQELTRMFQFAWEKSELLRKRIKTDGKTAK